MMVTSLPRLRLALLFLCAFGAATPALGRGLRVRPRATRAATERGAEDRWLTNLLRGDVAHLATHELAERFPRLSRTNQLRLLHKFGKKQLALCLKYAQWQGIDPQFEVEIPRERTGPEHVRDQEAAGLCWLFSFHAVKESGMVKQDLRQADLSETYLNYHAWLSRGEAALKKISASREPLDVELEDFSDGGYFDTARVLMERHGAAPERAMPTTWDARNSDGFIADFKALMTTAQLAFDEARGAENKEVVYRRHRELLVQLLNGMLGAPPATFRHEGREYTPARYYEEVVRPASPTEWVLLSSLPLRGAEWNRRYKVKGSIGEPDFTLTNVETRYMRRAVEETLRQGFAVWFTTAFAESNPFMVGPQEDAPEGALGLMDPHAFDYRALQHLVPFFALQKGARFDAGLATSNHAMTLSGFGNDRRGRQWFKVDNSWGPEMPRGGHLIMSRDYFDEAVDSVAVPKAVLERVLPEEVLRQIARATPTALPGIY
ncbi:MAG: hypothetical protein IT371_19790 [Deltaproteobacteria bacterium]|nr:hypothetical protein [Deltaproteobacteria bacterium]